MPKHAIDDDPAFAMTADAKALAQQKQLDAVLDKIADHERTRNNASDNIRKLWKVVEAQGHDVAAARRRFVQRMTNTPNT